MAKKLPFVKWFIKKNNELAKPYVTEAGETLPIRPLLGNGGHWHFTGHNKHDKKFLEKNPGILQSMSLSVD